MRPERANRQRLRERQRQREAEEELERGRRTGWELDHKGIVFPVPVKQWESNTKLKLFNTVH